MSTADNMPYGRVPNGPGVVAEAEFDQTAYLQLTSACKSLVIKSRCSAFQ